MSHVPLSPKGESQGLPFNIQGLSLNSEDEDPLSFVTTRPVSPRKDRAERRTEYKAMMQMMESIAKRIDSFASAQDALASNQDALASNQEEFMEFMRETKERRERHHHRDPSSEHQSPSRHSSAARNPSLSPVPVEPYRSRPVQPPGNYANVEHALNATRADRLYRSGLDRSQPVPHQSPAEQRRVFFEPDEPKRPEPLNIPSPNFSSHPYHGFQSFEPPPEPLEEIPRPKVGVHRAPGNPHITTSFNLPQTERRGINIPMQHPHDVPTSNSTTANAPELPRPNRIRESSAAPSAAPSATIITSRVHKIPSDLFIELDPKIGATDLYCNNLRHLAALYGDQSVIAGIPRSLQGRARDWWASSPMTMEEMNTVEGWVTAISREFPVYVPRAKAEAMAYKYQPTKIFDALDYFYAKINKLRSAERSMSDEDIIDFIWEGLPPGLKKLLDYPQLKALPLTEAGRVIGNKDLAYREDVLAVEERRVSKDHSSKERRRDHWKSTVDTQTTSSSLSPAKSSSTTSKIPAKARIKGKGKSNESTNVPHPLPREQWKTDKQGRTMTRKCRFCDQWHFDFDCPKRPTSYSLTTIVSESYGQIAPSSEESSDESSSSESSSSEEEPVVSSKPASYCTIPIYSTELPQSSSQPVKIPKAEDYIIHEVEPLPIMGTGVAYLSAEPCPIQAWIGKSPDSNIPISTGVADSGGPSIIQKDLIPSDYVLNASPLNPSFQGVGNHTTDVQGYVLLPIHFPNQAALDGNSKKARVLKLWIEFQVVDKLAAGFLIGRDALKGYKAIIDEEAGQIVFRITRDPFPVPILKRKYHTRKADSRIFATRSVHVRPRSEAWVPITFDQGLMESTNDVLITPVRKNTGAMQVHASCPHSIISGTTTHVLYLNPSDRPAKIGKGEIVAHAKPIETNTPMSYFGVSCPLFFSTAFANNSSMIEQSSSDVPIPSLSIFNEGGTVAALSGSHSDPLKRDDPIVIDINPSTISIKDASIDDINSHADALQNTIKSDTVKLEWHPYVGEIDPLGMDHEFRDPGPFMPQSNDDEERQEGDLEWDICPKLNRRQRRDWIRMLRKHLKIFAGPDGKNLGKVSSRYDMDIDADASIIKSQQPYRTSPRKRKLIREAVDKLLELKIIQPSNSSVASPVVVVVQKGKPRFCIDLREVNSKTTPDRYSLPRQDSIFRALTGAVYFSTMDCNKGYHQFGLTERARKLTAFVTEDGFWEYIRMPFGLKNAPAHFQRTIDAILGIYRWDFALAYIDDIIVYSKTFEEHILHCSLVLDALQSIGMTLDEKKCHWAYLDVDLLGHHISRLGLATQAEKVKAILAVPFPETIKKAQEILGMFNYYRIFIEHFAWIAGPLYDGLKKTETEIIPSTAASKRSLSAIHGRNIFPDTPATREAFEQLRQALASAPILINPDFDKGFILYTDACGTGIAGSLHQVWDEDGREHPVLYISRRLNPYEAKYTSTELECLGVVWCLDKLAHYVDGAKLKLVTDHSALKWIWGIKTDVNARLFKWSLQLSALKDKVTIVHRPGRFHQNVDVLSRNPMPTRTQPAYSITLIHLSKEWKEKLWNGYLADPYFRRIIISLQRLVINPNHSTGGEPTARITENTENTAPTTRDIIPESISAPTSAELSLQEFAQHQQEQPVTVTDGTFTLIGRTLYFSTQRSQTLRLCIPKELIKEILHLNHDLAGHPGIRRTFSAIYLRYYFPKMFRQTKHYGNNCAICQTSKPSNEKLYGSLYPIQTDEPFHTLSFDYITDLPVSHGKDALLTVTDKFTKAVRLIACTKTTTAEDTARLYIEICYPIFGLPVKIISDRDARFTSRFWTTLMHLLGVSQGLTAAFHPSADGQAEKTNQIVEVALRCFLGSDVDKYPKWTEYLPILEHEYNNMIHESTGYSPNQLRFAVQPRGIADLAAPPTEGSSELAETWAEELKCIREEARDSLAMAQRKQKKYAGAKKERKVFNVGDLVLLKYKRFGPGYKPPKPHDHKLAPVATPLRISERLSPVSYRLDLPAGSRIHDVVSIHHLRRYRGSGEDIRPLPIMVDDEKQWEVERIEGERIKLGRTEFLIRWKGYGDYDRTWEPLGNLENAQDSILDWRSSHPETASFRKSKQKPSSTRSPSASTHPMRIRSRIIS